MTKPIPYLFLKSFFLFLFFFILQSNTHANNFHPNGVSPVAIDDNFTTNEDVQLVANIGNNDSQSNSGNNVWSILFNPSHGIVQLFNNVFVRYTPVSNYNGKDTFYYKICANNGQCDTAMVVITISAVDDFPVATNDTYTINEDNVLNGNVAGNDTQSGDGGNVWSVSNNPINGAVLLNSTGTFLYVPNPNYNGKDSFFYRLCDIDGDCSTAKVVITIRPVNDLPVVVRDTFSTDENTPLASSVATNDTLSGDGGNSYSIVLSPNHGLVLFANNGSFTYIPFANYSGLDSFSYRLCDANGDCRSTFAVITVNPVNHFPSTLDNVFFTDQNTLLNAEVASNDTESSDGGNNWSLISGTSNGVLNFNSDGSFDYSPNFNFTGVDTFYYSLCDVDNDCSYAMAMIWVSNILPVQLLSFSANAIHSSAAALSWKVDQEINVNRYEIQRSLNGYNFTTVASVMATSEIASVKNYSFTDYFDPINSAVYYRLKIIDNDTKFEYSKVIVLQLRENNTNSSLNIYPNPFNHYFNMTLQSDFKEDAVMNIYNSKGQKYLQKSIKLSTGINSFNISNLNALPAGIYIIDVVGNRMKLTSRIIKL